MFQPVTALPARRGTDVRLLGSRHFYLFIGYWLILFVVMHRPIPRGLDFLPGGTDLAVHLVLYFGLTILGWRYLRVAVRKPSVRTLLAWGAVCIAYGAFDEWLQQFVGRKTSLSDWLDLWLDTPEEHFASYDGHQIDAEGNAELWLELGGEEFPESGWLSLVAYRC